GQTSAVSLVPDDELYSPRRVGGGAITLEQVGRLPAAEMSPQLLGERGENGDIAIASAFRDGEIDLGRVQVQAEIDDLDIDELRDPCSSIKEGFDHKPVAAP